MTFVLANVILILLAALIAYWWANQGFFSAFLHMICVIVAGTIALAFWEPLMFALLSGKASDGLITGSSLLVPFCVVLIVIRIAADKLAPSNVSIPQWANLVFGGISGAVAATITVGFLVIGLGHMQARNDIMSFNGYQRDRGDKATLRLVDQLWVPFHSITAGFYEYLSVGSMRSGRPLAQYTPHLDRQATLLRDGYDDGTGSVSMRPSGATIKALTFDPDKPTRVFVTVDFNREGLDFGTQLTISSAQIRLIENARGTARTVHPTAWWQPFSKSGNGGYYVFDSFSHIMSSKPGQNDTNGVVFEFNLPDDNFSPRFVQIKGVRYALPTDDFEAAGTRLVDRMKPQFEAPPIEPGQNIQNAITINNSSRTFNINLSRNSKPAGITLDDNTFITSTSGVVEMTKGTRIRSANAVKGIYEPEGTRVVVVDLSRTSSANVFGLQESLGLDASELDLLLTDDRGNTYTAVGHALTEGQTCRLDLDPAGRKPKLSDFPALPTAGSQKLLAIFYVTNGVTVTGLKLGDVNVGFCTVPIKSRF